MKIIVSAISGFTLSCLLFLLVVLPIVKDSWRAQGQTEGYLKANVAMHKTAATFFSTDPPNCQPLAVLGGAKPQVVEVVDCGAFKTLRVSNN